LRDNAALKKVCILDSLNTSTDMRHKILIVDDLDDARIGLRMIFQRAGYETLEAQDGVEGLEIATQEHPDLVLSDIVMPVMDGYELLQKIRERRIPTRVIMMSAERTTTRDIVVCIRAGACEFVEKPMDPKELLNLVRRVLAVETTLNLNVSETPPIVEQLIAETKNLEGDIAKLTKEHQRDMGKSKEENQDLLRKNDQLIKQLQYRQHLEHLRLIAIRLLCLAISVAIAVLIHTLNIISSTKTLILPFIIFVLLLLPIERIRKLTVKVPDAETGIEIDKQ
jgi:DNA-binding response OmpR family regulator